MRIAQVFVDLRVNYGGASKVVYLLAQELAAGKKDEVDVIICGEVEEGLERAFRLFQYPWQWMYMRELRRHLSCNDYDIVHVHGYNSFLAYHVTRMKKECGFSIVFTPHFHPTGKRPRLLRKAFDIVYGKRALWNSDVITVLSKIEKEQIIAAGVEPSRVRTVANPLDPDILRDVPWDIARKKFALKEKVVLFVGRLDENKGLPVLLEAFEKMGRKDTSLCIVGKDLCMEKGLRAIIAEKGLKDVQITGQVEKDTLLSLYSCASVLVLPSSYEAFGMVLLEAMAKGVPVVGTEVGGIPEVLNGGECGLLVPYGDAGALAEALGKAIDDDKLRARLIRAGKERALDFAPSRVAGEFLKIYHSLHDENVADEKKKNRKEKKVSEE